MKRHIDLVAEGARRFPGRTATVGNGRRLTFAEIDDRVGRLGASLRGRGVRPGDRVALLATNELEYLEIQAACVRCGYTLVPLNWRLAVPELEFILRDCTPAVVIAGRGEEERVGRIAAAAGSPQLAALGEPEQLEPYDDLLASAEPDPEADPLDLDLLTTILYTSGTTGRPKGAMIDRAGMTARVFVNATELEARGDDVFLEALPMFHISAFLAYAYAFRGATVVQLPTFSPKEWLELQQAERATSTVLVPTMIGMLLDDPVIDDCDTSSLRLIVYGGASIEPPLLRRALARFGCGFHQQYGMTETGAQTILRPADHDPDDDEMLSSGGTDAASFEVRIHDPEDRPLPARRDRRDLLPRPCGDVRLLGAAGGERRDAAERLDAHGRSRLLGHTGVPARRRPAQRHGHHGRRERLSARGGGGPVGAPGDTGGSGDRPPRPEMGRGRDRSRRRRRDASTRSSSRGSASGSPATRSRGGTCGSTTCPGTSRARY